MAKELLAWVELYQSKCKENKRLRAEVDILQKILHSYLVIIDGKDNTNNERR